MNEKKSRKFSLRDNHELMKILLTDKTTNKNITWATDNYQDFNFNLVPEAEINLDILTNSMRTYIQPRIKKDLNIQKERTKKRAEVFTPTWIVEKQVELIHKEFENLSLEDYVDTTWLEITCGEAPYVCTRYDMTTGNPIDVKNRVGFLDKKLSRINEETINKEEWLSLVKKAYKATYGYEYQGDSLLIARENLLFTFIDYYFLKFGIIPCVDVLMEYADIISTNIIQMDGLNYSVPHSESYNEKTEDIQLSFFHTVDELKALSSNKKLVFKKAKIKFKDKNIKFYKLIEGVDNMKFDVVIGNPPYQGEGRQQIYTDFYLSSIQIGMHSCLIFPTGWQGPKNANNLRKMNNEKIKRDKQIIKIIELKNAFPNVPGASNTNILLWKRGFDNELDGSQLIISNVGEERIELLPITKRDIEKPYFIVELANEVKKFKEFKSVQSIISRRKPYGLSTDIIRTFAQQNLPPLNDVKTSDEDIRVYTVDGFKFVDKNYPFPRLGAAFNHYKVFVPYAWGGFGDEGVGLGGAYSDIFIAKPRDTCIETYLECGPFSSRKEAEKMAKYMMTRFFRGLLYLNKYSQHSTTAFGAIPIQTFKEDWWSGTIKEINLELFKKYKIPNEIIKKVNNNIQIKSEENIIFL